MTARRRCAIATDSTCDWRVVHLPSFSFQRIRKDKKLNSLANQELRWLGLGWSGNFWIGPSLLKFGPGMLGLNASRSEFILSMSHIWWAKYNNRLMLVSGWLKYCEPSPIYDIKLKSWSYRNWALNRKLVECVLGLVLIKLSLFWVI